MIISSPGATQGYIDLPIQGQNSSSTYIDLPFPQGISPGGIPATLWLDGNDPLATGNRPANGALISAWNDKSGNNANFLQPTMGNQPAFQTNAVNGLGSVAFTLLNNNFVTYSSYFILAGSPFDFFFVINPSTVNGNSAGYTFFYTDQGNAGTVGSPNFQTPVLALSPTHLNFFSFGFVSGTFLQTFTPNETYLIEFSYNGGTITIGTNYLATVNGNVLIRDGTISGNTGRPTALGSDGATADINLGYGGLICEVLFYNSVLTTPQRSTIQNYFGNKWGIAV